MAVFETPYELWQRVWYINVDNVVLPGTVTGIFVNARGIYTNIDGALYLMDVFATEAEAATEAARRNAEATDA